MKVLLPAQRQSEACMHISSCSGRKGWRTAMASAPEPGEVVFRKGREREPQSAAHVQVLSRGSM